MPVNDASSEGPRGRDEELEALLEEREDLVVAIAYWKASDRAETAERVAEFESLLVEIDEEILGWSIKGG